RSFVANIKSQIKRNKTNEKARLRNLEVKSEMRTYARRVHQAAKAGDKDAATSALRDASRKLDKAAGKGAIHKNQAANRKSALAKVVNALYGLRQPDCLDSRLVGCLDALMWVITGKTQMAHFFIVSYS